MNPEFPAIAALNRYLGGEWDFDQLYVWAITFGDTDERRNDEPSMSIAAQVLMWIFEMSDGIHTQNSSTSRQKSVTASARCALDRRGSSREISRKAPETKAFFDGSISTSDEIPYQLWPSSSARPIHIS